MTPGSMHLQHARRRAAALAGALLLWPAALAAAGTPDAGAPAAETAVLASVDGAPITVGQVREIMRVTGAGAQGAGRALEVAVESQLLYAEGVRRGLDKDPQVAASVAGDAKRLLVEQYVLSRHRAELTPRDPGSFHTGPAMSGKHGGMMSQASLLGDKIEKLEKEASESADLVMLPEVYQGVNLSVLPRGQLVVARLGGESILWSEVEEFEPGVRGVDPPLVGMTALRFVRAIRALAGKKTLYREAEAALPTFRVDFDRALARLERAAVARRLLALEVDSRAALGEAELRAYFDANPGRYGLSAAPQDFAKVRGKVKVDAERDAKARLRAEYAGRLRAAAAVTIDQQLLESLGR